MPAWLRKLDRKLVDVAAGRCPRLIVNVGPQFGKSEMISRAFPAWFLGTFPRKKVLLASYGAQYAGFWGANARDLFAEMGPPVFGVGLDPSRTASDWWFTDQGGYMSTAGAGGALTGKGADGFIVDDALKNDEAARSQYQRDQMDNWFRSVVRTRLQPGGWIAIVCTRWHHDDLAGRLLSRGGWELLSFPSLAVEDDILGRHPGDPLDPGRFSLAELLAAQADLGPYYFAALHQQNPVPDTGTVFERANLALWRVEYAGGERFYRIAPPPGTAILPILVPADQCSVFTTGDLAISERETADFTVFATWAWSGVGVEPWRGKLILLDLVHKRLPGPDQLPALTAAMERTGSDYAVLESTQYQMSLVQHARRAGLNVKEAQAKGDKYARAQPAAAKWMNRDIAAPEGAPWLEEWLAEHVAFNSGRHDDMVDTTAYAALESKKGASKLLAGWAPSGTEKVASWRLGVG